MKESGEGDDLLVTSTAPACKQTDGAIGTLALLRGGHPVPRGFHRGRLLVGGRLPYNQEQVEGGIDDYNHGRYDMRFRRAGLLTACVLCAWAVVVCGGTRTSEKKMEERWNALSPQVKEVLNRVEKAGKGLKTVKCDVQYTRSIPLLEEKEECDGELLFEKPDKLVLKLGEPRNEDAYTDGSKWWIVSHNDKQVEVYRMVENPRQTREAAFLKFGYGRSARKLLDQYEISLAEKRSVEAGEDGSGTVTEFVLRFTPREQEAPSRYSWIEVAVREGTWLPVRLRLAENEGRIMHIYRLADRKLDVDLQEGIFTYDPPEGYNILQPAAGKRQGGGR